jgi:hypothetical protein
VSLLPSLYAVDADDRSYVLETMTSFVLIFIAFGVGLDPRQREVFGPALSPILVRLPFRNCGGWQVTHIDWARPRSDYLCFGHS